MKLAVISKKHGLLLGLLCSLLLSCGVPTTYKNSKAKAPSHKLWDTLLQTHVSPEGMVDYKGLIKDSTAFRNYLEVLSSHPPAEDWTKEEKLAYWINAYNAFTIQLIVDHYPVESIQDLHPKAYIPLVNSVWHKRFFQIGGKPMTLNAIEHKILRPKFEEPRIHFAIVCASKSCPKLLDQAYTPEALDQQLTTQAKAFLADDFRNKITPDHIQLSKIFSWFKGDFTKDQSLIAFLNQYAPVPIEEQANISYLEYDWSLNEK